MGKLAKVAEIADLAPGQGRVVEVEGKAIALFNVDGAFYAIDNTCLHRGGPLGEGELDGAVVTCPWHGWCYDVTTGANTAN
ncbi:MAG: Rieske 2Fe-2S domain-containing protein, partial [Candidatus Rokubacteria bacterium]|nr:Rieske 2Fe-2S domain-containing protein [Candidatus Rokubacteria bacterium]